MSLKDFQDIVLRHPSARTVTVIRGRGKKGGTNVAKSASPRIVLIGRTVTENSAVNTVVGTLSMVATTGTPAYTLTDTAGGRFKLVGSSLQVATANIDYETAAAHTVIVSVSGVTPVVSPTSFVILVIDVTGVTPEAPILTITSLPSDNTPDFTLTGDLALNDTVRFQYSTASDFTGASELTNTIDAGEDAANTITFATGALAVGAWYFRARIERPEASVSSWSNTQTITLVSSAATTWNPADKTSNLTLTVSNTVATYNTTGNQNANIRSVAPIGAGQDVYIEFVVGSITTAFIFGFATLSTPPNGPGAGIGTPSTAFGFSTGGKFQCNDSIHGTDNIFSVAPAGARVGIAYSPTRGKAWARTNGGGWNTVQGGAQDPVAGTGGCAVPAMGTLYVHCGLDANPGDFITAKFATASWVDAPPSGYTQVAA